MDFNAPKKHIINIWFNSQQFKIVTDMKADIEPNAAFTGMPADIDPKPGGTFKIFNGMIEGRNIELVPAQRVVQAWRPSSWSAGRYCLVHFELKPRAQQTTVILDHTGFAEGDFDHFDSGWHLRYWNPLKKFLA